MKTLVLTAGVISLLALVTASGAESRDPTIRAIERHDEAVETRPVDPARNPPSLSTQANGVESSIPVVVQRRLDGDPELRTQHIKVAGNERRNITLSGEVTSAALKQRAQDLAQGVSGVQHVHNDIVIVSPSERRAPIGDDASTTDRSDPKHRMPQRE